MSRLELILAESKSSLSYQIGYEIGKFLGQYGTFILGAMAVAAVFLLFRIFKKRKGVAKR
jgi:hypothetical protein